MVDDTGATRRERDLEARLDALPGLRARQRDAEALIAEHGQGAVDATWERVTDAERPERERNYWAGVSVIVRARRFRPVRAIRSGRSRTRRGWHRAISSRAARTQARQGRCLPLMFMSTPRMRLPASALYRGRRLAAEALRWRKQGLPLETPS